MGCQQKRSYRCKTLLLAVMVLIFALCLSACKEETISLMDADGEFQYTIIRPDEGRKTEASAASTLRKCLIKVLELGELDIDIDTDWIERGTTDDEIAARWEILVGKTNRKASVDAFESLEDDQFTIQISEDTRKIVIVGCDEEHTRLAVEYFLKTYVGYELDKGDFTAMENIELPKVLNVLKTEVYTPTYTGDGIQIVNTKYTTEDVVVADIVITPEKYKVDPLGTADSTAGIQKALNDCKSAGGGTVFLPEGKYRVTKTVTIPAFTCLRGDWQDPDDTAEKEYGTLILADVKSSDAINTGLFLLGGSGGAYGLTVYYPQQTIENVIPYSFAFYAPGSGAQENFMASTVKNCTIINGYYGVGATADSVAGHEQFTVENVKGTFLKTAVYIGRSSDVGTCTNVTMSTKYWVEFAEAMGYAVPDAQALKAYTRKNTTGLILSDVEWTQFTHMTFTDCVCGIHIIPATRIQFAGCFYDIVITDCEIAVQADELDSRWGMELSNCYLAGSKYGIINNTKGLIKTAGTTIMGGMQGTVLVDTDSLTGYPIDTGVTYTKVASVLYVAELDKNGNNDISEKLQTLLDNAGKTGGVVYLPAGTYRLDKAITVPAGVELRGCSSLTTRDQTNMSAGTMIAAYYGVGGGEKDTAMITLGEGAGVNGIRIFYPTNGSTLRETSYTIRGTGKNVYVVNSAIVSAGRGVDFSGCDNHLIKKLTSFCFINDIRVGGENGTVCGFLHNATVRARKNFADSWVDDTEIPDPNQVARIYCTTMEVVNAKNEHIWSVFSYGVEHMVRATNSTGTRVFNLGSDNINDQGGQLVISGGDFFGVNIMRYNGHSYDTENGAKVTLYSRLAINEKREDTVK